MLKDMIAGKRPLVVDFYTSWCGPCRVLSPIVDEISEEYRGRVEVIKINIDEQQDLAAEYSILSIPTLLFFRDGREVGRVEGAIPGNRFREEIEKLLGAKSNAA